MMFTKVPIVSLVQNVLFQLPSQEARIQTVVEMSFNNVEIRQDKYKLVLSCTRYIYNSNEGMHIYLSFIHAYVMLVRANRNDKRVAWQRQWTSLKRFGTMLFVFFSLKFGSCFHFFDNIG